MRFDEAQLKEIHDRAKRINTATQRNEGIKQQLQAFNQRLIASKPVVTAPLLMKTSDPVTYSIYSDINNYSDVDNSYLSNEDLPILLSELITE